MRLWVLGSGSRGNAVLLESGGSRLLVDAGFGMRVLQTRLAALGVAPESIAACVITHEHTDHVKGAAQASARWGWKLHASEGTIAAHAPLTAAGTTAFRAGDTLTLPGFTVETVRTPHDARESVALVATGTSCGTRAGVCYDLGHATEPVRSAMRGVDMLVLEANHDGDMLRAGPYPPSVCDRIAGRYGHLSNAAAGALARQLATTTLRHVVLAHLSESCNAPDTAATSMRAALATTRFRGAITPSAQDAIVGPFVASAGRAVVRAQQLTLAL
ncbi:MAG: MBL fold metallo-hydrolase [Gemmatirosa sp.]